MVEQDDDMAENQEEAPLMAASEKQKAMQKKWRAKQNATNKAEYRQKTKVRNKVNNAVRDARRKAPPKSSKCPNCGKAGFRKEWHHSNGYSTSKGEWRCSACNPRPGK